MNTAMKPAWVIYMVRCSDSSLYTGITRDVVRRIKQHNGELTGGAKYTRARQPVALVYQQIADTRSEATIREMAIKKMTRDAKETMIQDCRNDNVFD